MLRKSGASRDASLLAECSEPCAKYAGLAYSDDGIIAAVSQSFQNYKTHGSRSTEKLKPLHQYAASVLAGIWALDFRVCYMGEHAKEIKIEGKYYPKDIDVAITDPFGKPVFCLGIKFVTSNYKQNANNYFESMMGETANIQALNNIPYAQLIILRHKTPYYQKNETERPSKIEIINGDDIRKYIRLMLDGEQAHRPKFIGIKLVDIDESAGLASSTLLGSGGFSPEIADLLAKQLSPSSFFSKIREYRDCLCALR